MTIDNEQQYIQPSSSAATLTIVAGSFPPDQCGVGDYTAQLLSALQRRGTIAACYHSSRWQLQNLFDHWRHLRKLDHILLLQHPSAGFNKRLTPFLLWILLWRHTKAITLHEFSRKSPLGKLLCYAFFLFSKYAIFTTETERRQALRFAPWLARRSTVIPIGSNIPFIAAREHSIDVVYFGLIIPGKGLEEFLDIVTDLSQRRSCRIQLIGQIVRGAENFADSALARLRALDAQLLLNADIHTVAETLAASRIVLLPFPDGISARRGSALAAMGNGALLITTPPQDTSTDNAQFHGRCLMGNNRWALLSLVEAALDNPAAYAEIIEAGRSYAQSFAWSDIAERHIAFLQQSILQSVPDT